MNDFTEIHHLVWVNFTFNPKFKKHLNVWMLHFWYDDSETAKESGSEQRRAEFSFHSLDRDSQIWTLTLNEWKFSE